MLIDTDEQSGDGDANSTSSVVSARLELLLLACFNNSDLLTPQGKNDLWDDFTTNNTTQK